jgi:hypothetical protein
MKIVAIALVSAALIAFAGPSFAQQNMNRDQSDHMDRSQYGSGMHRQFQNDEEQSGTSGQANNGSDRDNWRDRNSSDNRDWGRIHRWGMRGNMEGRMGSMMRMHERMANANEGAAHFRFRRGQAAIDVQCPEAESLQTCVNAAGQLLDKIGALRDRNAQGATQGMGLGSENSGTAGSQSGGSSSDQQTSPPAATGSRSGL